MDNLFDWEELERRALEGNTTSNLDEGVPEQYRWTGISAELRGNISDMLFKAMTTEKLTCDEFAKKLGISPTLFSRYLHARHDFTISELSKLLYKIGVKVKLTEISDTAG